HRFDLKSELFNGLPYSLSHASLVAESLVRLMVPPVLKKGLITDLDDTLWSGIVGEIGVDKVSWDLSSHTHLHALYQQTLRALADQGVLVGVATRNDPAVVATALSRSDLLILKERLFPIEAHWKSKSSSVRRILATWNIGPSAAVFVDDNPRELEEVKAAFPEI